MGAVKLCAHHRAKTPYYAETTGIHLYSVEELAYYLYENIYLIDDHMIGEKLYMWIEKELHMPKLAERLRNGNSTGTHVYNQVMNILNASEYYSEEELSALSEKITAISGLQTQERMKYKADELLQNENYWAAITEYERILSIRQSTRLNVVFYANVWNNLAVCYGRLFMFKKAAGCFESAYGFQKIQEYKEKAYYARKLGNSGKKEPEQLLELKVSAEFVVKAGTVLKELEETSHLLEEPEDYLKTSEKKYLRNSYI